MPAKELTRRSDTAAVVADGGDEEGALLSRDLTAPHELPIDLLRSYPADEMEAHLANPLVGNARNNSPEMLNSSSKGCTDGSSIDI